MTDLPLHELIDVADPRVLVTTLAHHLDRHDLVERAAVELPRPDPATGVSAMPPALRAEVADLVPALLAAPPLPPIDDATLTRLASFCAAEPVPDEYLRLIREESGIDGDLRRPRWTTASLGAEHRPFRVAVIGAGFGGICTAIRLHQAGVAFDVLEKNAAVGGTWHENDYPGLRVDVPNHFYSYSFAPNAEWTDHYARRREIDDYIERVVDEHGVRDRVRLGTEVVSAVYDEAGRRWAVATRSAGGEERVEHYDVVVSAVGMLNRPRRPDLAGLESFAGPAFHSSHWDHSIDLRGKRVGVVGTGASAVQIVPGIAGVVGGDEGTADVAGHVHVFQRSRHWVLPNPRYLAEVSEAERGLFRRVPGYQAWYRFLLLWQNGDRLYPAFCVDPEWTEPDRSISLANDKVRRRAVAAIAAQVDGDEELLARLVPDYPPFGKRILQDGGWYRALTRPDVTLQADGIDHVEPTGVVTTSGELVELDVLVLATGFHADRFLWPIEVVGRGGERLHDRWGDDPRAHLGITVPGFPNLFCLYGPNTNPVVGSVIHVLESQVQYVIGAVEAMLRDDLAAVECRQDVHDDYNRRVDTQHETMVWRHPRVHSYYNNAAGRVVTNVPWRLVDYWRLTSAPDLSDFHVTPCTPTTEPSEPS